MLPPFGWHAVVTQWQFAPVVTGVVAAAAVLYGWGVIRVRLRHPARPWPAWRTVLFAAGLAVVVVATESGVGAYDDVLFWDHMVQHLLLIMVAPVLLIFGQPITLLLHASRNPLHTWAKRAVRSKVASFLTWPVFGAVAYTAAIVVAHLTNLADLMLHNSAVHDGEHAVFLVIGYLFFLPLVGREPIRWRLSYPVRFIVLILIMPVDTFTGLVLAYSNKGPGVPVSGLPWAPSPAQDLHAGGAVMWIGGDAVMFGLMMLVFLMWSMDERASVSGHGWLESARRASLESMVSAHRADVGEQPAGAPAGTADAAANAEWSGGIDDDAHLAAYNAFLARLNQADSGRER
jgi:putative copper resistance protein D